jgi:hypothetical protein
MADRLARGLDQENKTRIRTNHEHPQGSFIMVRLARESLAFVSVAGFVWMMCQVAVLAG